jgi:predicted Rossmann fold nucleotide-binding protein DprA/Smf involved in DNA uptake
VLAVVGVDAVPASPAALEPRLAAVRAAVADAPAAADEIVRATGLRAAIVAAALAELELAGVVVQADGLFRVVMPVS